MTGKELIETRTSIRRYKSEAVSKELICDIMETVRFAPSWANYQIARYTFISDRSKIEEIMCDGVCGFGYNIKTLKSAPNVVVLSAVRGKSGKLNVGESYSTAKGDAWEAFDAGIACQTFCLAAHGRGIGTCIMGVIAAKKIAEIVDLPADETVMALITFGYPDEPAVVSGRLAVETITRFI